LSRQVAEMMRERDEVHVDGEQHQLDRHQQDDEVLAVEEDADHPDRKEQRPQDEVMAERDHVPSLLAAPVSGGSFTMRSRPAFVAASCVAGSWYLVSLRLRCVRAIAATMATSRMTAAISNG